MSAGMISGDNRFEDGDVREAFRDLEFMRPLNRKRLLSEIQNGGHKRDAVQSAIFKFMKFWSDAGWVDNSVTLVGFWLAKEAPDDFHVSLKEIAVEKEKFGYEGEKIAWGALVRGMVDGNSRKVVE